MKERGGGEEPVGDLVGAGPSKVGVGGAMRARDVSRPTPEDMAEAERSVRIIRRTRPHPGPVERGSGNRPDAS